MKYALFAILLCSCGVSVEETKLAPWPSASMRVRTPRAVEFVTCQPSQPYTATLLFHATNFPGAKPPVDMIAAIRERAEVDGCDAVQLATFDPEPKGHSVIDAYCLVYRVLP